MKLSQGYQSLCYLSPPPSHREAIVCERVAQYRRAAAREGMDLHELDGADAEASVAATTDLPAPPLIAFNDMVATHATTAASRHRCHLFGLDGPTSLARLRQRHEAFPRP